MNMVGHPPNQKWTTPPNNRSPAPSKHTRSQSSPYFHYTRSFTSDSFATKSESRLSQTPILSPVTSSHISANPIRQNPGRLQRHNRSLTTNASHRPPLVTTDIRVETTQVALPSSIFSGSSPIKFDLSPPESPLLSPEKDNWNFIPSFKIDKKSIERSPSPSRISTWFQGESAPINFGLVQSPTKEASNLIDHYPIVADRRSIMEAPKTDKPNSFFSSFFTAKAIPTVSIPQDTNDDEFLNLDIKRALQPQGQGDPFSPSAFKNLQQNAEGLIARMQTAYRQQTLAINDVKAEQEVQKEELEEAQTRAHHLKAQLDSLGIQVDDQNNEITRLLRELQEEKRLHQGDVERISTIRFVNTDQVFDRRTGSRASLGSTTSTPSMLSDIDSIPSDMSDHFGRDNTSTVSSPATPMSIMWSQDHQLSLSGEQKLFQQTNHLPIQVDLGVAQENTELRSRVGHLEKELDNCLDILKGFGL